MTEAEQIMKRCQAGTRNYEEANNLHAACYGIIGKLLAQPEQEPNWAWICNECGAQEFTLALCKADLDYLASAGCGSNEFHKEALAQEQEPVADDFFRMIADRNPKPFSSLQRTWVALTDEEIEAIWHKDLWKSKKPHHDFARAIEAKLKELNK